ncbi:glycosyltransferase family 4 protein [Cloacibacterium normanense]|uniref:glycosyltransferase family 4 protein n=1 Tax=Cloacibacterium normanense TaxID=237258 RepID=UPI00391CBC12
MKTLLYITNAIDGSGGLERVLSVKTKVLAEDYGYDIHVVTLNQKSKTDLFFSFSEKIIQHNIEVSGNTFQYFSKYRAGINKVIAKIKPDVISVCDDGLKGFFIPILLRKKTPTVYERHASVQLNFSKKSTIFKNQLTYYLMRVLAKTFDAFVVLTKGNVTEWKNKNVKVIPNLLSFYPETSSNLKNKTVIAVGSHSYNKGYDLLLYAWKQVVSLHPDWELHIYGKYDEAHTYITLANRLKIKKNVFFSPPVKDIDQAYLNSSIMVLPSRSEGFGMVLIEAMACGLPCVCFECPHGPADIISHDSDGLLVPNGDVEGLANALKSLIENENKRIAMGGKAKENVKRFLPQNVVKQWDELFKKLNE